MTAYRNWKYNEFNQVGTDYENLENVRAYDERMQKIRDIKTENEFIIQSIGLKKHHTILEFGCGTGSFSIEAAKHCKKVYAVDVSSTMLKYLKNKADKSNVQNITTIHSGFLNYEHEGEPLDAVVTNVALHHLPDFWKMIALYRINNILKQGGKLFLCDVIFSFPLENYAECINKFIDNIGVEDPGFSKEAEIQVREEFSTFDWILKGMLERANFSIDKVEYMDDKPFICFICTRNKLNSEKTSRL